MNSIFYYLERFAARAQGKGFGAGTSQREFQFASKLLKGIPSLLVDVGANRGVYTEQMRARYPAAEIHAIEPAASNVAALREKFAGDSNVHVAPFALGEATASATLFANSAGSRLASLTKRQLDHFGIDFDYQEAVEVVRFEDYWIERLGSRPIDFVKIDVEGHELNALRGFGRAIEQTQTIQFEFGGCNIDTRTYFRDFWYFFSERGFSIHRIAPYSLQRIKAYRECEEFFSTTNFLATRNNDA